MKRFTEFLKEADMPTNVTGAAVSTDQPVVRKANKYKRNNARAAPKPVVVEADINAVGDSYEAPNEMGLYAKRNNKNPLKISKLLKKLLSKNREI